MRRQELVAVVHPIGLGNMICLLGSIPALRQRHPNAWFALISPRGCWRIAASSGLADVTGDCDGLLHKLVERSRSACVCYRPFLPDEYRPRRPQLMHLADEFASVLGVRADLSQIRLRAPEDVRRRLARRLREVNPDRRVVIVLHPGPTWAVRAWPAERWQELAQLICKNIPSVVIRIGVDRPWLAPSLPHFPGTIDWTNRLDVTETVALLEQADALVAVESGPLHIAGVLGLPAVGLFGPTSSNLFLHPRGRVTAVTSGVDCLGCHHAAFGPVHWEAGCPRDIACMNGISAEAVFTALVGLQVFEQQRAKSYH